MYIPDVLNTLLMGLIFMVIVVTVVRPIMLNLLTGQANPQDVQRAAIEDVHAHVQRATLEAAAHRTGKIRYQQLLLALPERRQPLPPPPMATEANVAKAESDVGNGTSSDVQGSSNLAGVDSAAGDVQSSAGVSDAPKAGEIEIGEGESLHDIKERIKREKKNSAKPTIPPELLNSAKSYEDKVGVVRMVVQQDNSRVAGVIRGMIEVN
ncbi:hypothetical protein [Limnohabitans sp. B9-3]|uniref:hypothetical protein n=1 Tax=Limnohabitans sp. B9-3 TaxID=1100707 RepID=UPI000C1DF42E|nr:hypothetical protein [Limnohabitans sp. B9-3]PIT76140.1 hypothetical protein B9Z42_05345 [Limnohabitans sp. B9-3]